MVTLKQESANRNTWLNEYLQLKKDLIDLEIKLHDIIKGVDKLKADIDQIVYIYIKDANITTKKSTSTK